MRRLYVLGLAALAAIALSAHAQVAGQPGTATPKGKTTSVTKKKPQDALSVGPTIYRLILENERVRVMEVRFQPGEKITAHTHPDHVVVVTSAGKLAITNASGTQEFDAKVGDAFFIPAETHSAENVGTTEFAGVVTELKGKTKAKDSASPRPGTTDVQQGKVDG
jgi:quercetin dioxygenase-like cupin family protein